MSQYINSSMSYESKMHLLENNLRTINNNYYGTSSPSSMDKSMYYSSMCNTSYSGNSSSSSSRSMSREPNYTVGQWSIEGIL